MAIDQGAGTEIIRCHHFEDVADSGVIGIKGVQHHIYTVLSIIAYATAVNAAGVKDFFQVYLQGYDSLLAESNENLFLLKVDVGLDETFVWNDKFSFNGFEPTDFAATLDETKQIAIAAQASGVAQQLIIGAEHAASDFDVWITFIDQNNE